MDFMVKYFVLSVLCLACGACGFQPVYGLNNAQAVGAQHYMAATNIANIRDREGQVLRNHLVDRFHRDGAGAAQYILSVRPINEIIRDLDITKTSDSTRAQLSLKTTMTLTDVKSGQVLLQHPLKSIVSYNILASEFSTRVSENNARANGLKTLADQIETRVSLYFQSL